MKFVCEKNAILREVSVAQEIIAEKNVLSILSNVLLEASDNTLTLKATDMKVGFETRLPVEVRKAGSTTVFCDKLLAVLRSLPEGGVEFEQTEGRMIIKPEGKKIDFQLKSIASDKFPELKATPQESYFSFSQKDLNEMIAETIFAVSDDETRYFMNGVYLEHQEGSLVMVATDGRRLSFISRAAQAKIAAFPGVIVPPKILHLVRKLSTGEGTVHLAISEKSVFIQFESQKLWSSLIEGQFPNYRRVIPERQEYAATVRRDELLDALKRVSLLVEQKSRRVYLDLAKNALTLRSEEGEIGSAAEELSVEYDGPEVTLALNYLYLTEPLRVMESASVSIRFTEETKAISLYPVPDRDFFHIVMPMQVN